MLVKLSKPMLPTKSSTAARTGLDFANILRGVPGEFLFPPSSIFCFPFCGLPGHGCFSGRAYGCFVEGAGGNGKDAFRES